MSLSDDELGDLLRALPPAPAELVERVKRLPEHAEAFETDDAADEGDGPGDYRDDAPPEVEDDSADSTFGDADTAFGDSDSPDDPLAG